MVGSNTVKVHKELAYKSQHHEAAALIKDHKLSFMQSGVLVRDNIVITAAHGMQMLVNANYPFKDFGTFILISPRQMTVTFSPGTDQEITYNVESVMLDSRYIRFEQGDQHKYDIAILKISEPVQGIKPVKLLNEVIVNPDNPMLVITWGNADIPREKVKRAFYLFEWSLFFPKNDEDSLADFRTVMLSSLFFDPAEKLPPKPDMNDPESVQRRYFALKSWMGEQHPYALALPGTSGAPVFVEVKTNQESQYYLFGLIMGYSTLGEEMQLLSKDSEELAKNPSAAYNKYQTIITTPFRLNTKPKANTTEQKHFIIDKRYIEMIDNLSKGRA